MKKIGVISDAHGNLEATKVALDYLKSQNCEEIIHTGDVVSIGPNSAETLQLLLSEKVLCLMGNHDLDLVNDASKQKPFSHVSTEHKEFVFSTLQHLKDVVASFPLSTTRICGGKKIVFEHYCRLPQPSRNGAIFHLIINPPTVEQFDEMYRNYDCDAVFFGHKHEPCDLVGNKLYVDVGSIGCHPESTANGVIISFDETHFEYSRFSIPYDQAAVEKKMTSDALPSGQYLFDFYFLHKK